jgi:hypothetical protein
VPSVLMSLCGGEMVRARGNPMQDRPIIAR